MTKSCLIWGADGAAIQRPEMARRLPTHAQFVGLGACLALVREQTFRRLSR